MMKLTLSLLMLMMKHQGSKGKYYTVQKASIFISGFFSLFFTGIVKFINLLQAERNLLLLFIFLWVVFFLAHYVWFLKEDKSKTVLHYFEYKRNLIFFLCVIIASILLLVI
jgi:hypothetical protein